MGRDLQKAALRGEPSYVWREGQERRLRMILDHARRYIRQRMRCGRLFRATYANRQIRSRSRI